MSESAKHPTLARRLATGIFASWESPVLDIGSGPDVRSHDWPARLVNMGGPSFERIRFDREHGDAHGLEGVADQSFPTVYASHVLEHLERPLVALAAWVRVYQVGGRVFIAVPHRQLYECGKEAPPSLWSVDHLWFFNPYRHGPHSRVLGLAQLLLEDLPPVLGEMAVCLEYLATCDWGYKRIGNAHPAGEYQVEASLVRVR